MRISYNLSEAPRLLHWLQSGNRPDQIKDTQRHCLACCHAALLAHQSCNSQQYLVLAGPAIAYARRLADKIPETIGKRSVLHAFMSVGRVRISPDSDQPFAGSCNLQKCSSRKAASLSTTLTITSKKQRNFPGAEKCPG